MNAKSRAELTARAEQARKGVLELHGRLLRLVQWHGKTIATRYSKKVRDKRKALFKKVDPDILPSPIDLPPASPPASLRAKLSFLNLEDLTMGTNFISLVATRALHSLSDWAFYDCPDRAARRVERAPQPGMIIYGDDTSYGTLVFEEGEEDKEGRIERRDLVPASEGFQVLALQNQILSFLVTSVELILQDVDHTNPPKDLVPLTLGDVISIHPSSGRSLLERYRLRGYSYPPNFSKGEVMQTILAKVHQAEDEIWLLRTDPIYFHMRMQEYLAHSLDKPKGGGKRKASEEDRNIWDDLIQEIVTDVHQSLENWTLALRQLQILMGIVPETHFDTEPQKTTEIIILQDPSASEETGLPPVAEEDEDGDSDAGGYDDGDEGYAEEDRSKGGRLVLFQDVYVPTKPMPLDTVPERCLATLEVILERLASDAYSLPRSIWGCPGLRHLFRPIERGPSEIREDYALNKELARKEMQGSSSQDVLELLLAVATSRVSTNTKTHLFTAIDDLLARDVPQRNRLSHRIMETMSPLFASNSMLPGLRAHPERHHLLGPESNKEAFDRIESDTDGILHVIIYTEPHTLPFQQPYIFNGRKPSHEQEAKASRALAKLWAAVDETCDTSTRCSLLEMYKDFIPPRLLSPDHDGTTVDLASLSHKPVYVIPVKKKVFKVFETIFSSTTDGLPEVDLSWEDFKSGMRHIGFRTELMFATEWRFTPTVESNWPEYPITFYEPFPQPRLSWQQLRAIAKRLYRRYALQRSSFVLSD